MTSTPPACPGEKEKGVSSVNTEEMVEELKSVDNWTLRPADHGAHAWLFLCASFLMEGLSLARMSRLLEHRGFLLSQPAPWCVHFNLDFSNSLRDKLPI
ncbi:hypothetical protein E4U60_007503 [Claviceps pazoutovae]|uniref:Uncharacterized protein n=1 Tax=Claviceps pazoutovae TaxID=1649127 RepID=A0A9P7M442_9HYPO|nr:hypothetical protein E4U60_007503 [Claviceps pazoutovae]